MPQEGSWDQPPAGKELARLLKNQPELGIGLRLGRCATGRPWLVDILVKNVREAAPALKRMLAHHRDQTATWSDEDGTHRVFVGDDRLEALGSIVVGAFRDNGGNPHYPAIEIRLGSADPATSLAVLPPTPLIQGKPRQGHDHGTFQLLPESFYDDLAHFAGPTEGGAEDTRAASIAPVSSPGRVPSPRQSERAGTAVTLRGPADPHSGEVTDLESAGPEGPELSAASDLAALARDINQAHQDGESAALEALDHYRRAGERLRWVKDRVGHGGFQDWVRDHCEFGYRSAAAYMTISRRWSEVVDLLETDVPHEATPTLSGVLKGLARSRTGRATEGPLVVGAIGPADAGASDELPTGPDAGCGLGRIHEPGRVVPADLEARAFEGRAEISPRLTGSPPALPADSGEASSEPLAGHDVPNQSGPTTGGSQGVQPVGVGMGTGHAPTGLPITEAKQRWAADLCFLIRQCPIYAKLQKLGNIQAFRADATTWRLLRPVVEEFRARHRPATHDDGPRLGLGAGLYAPRIVALALGRSPEQWILCPACGGAGRVSRDGPTCPECSGGGYSIDG